MKILHVVDYLMPKIGYQEFLLPKWNKIHGHETYIICADRYTPIPDYDKIWGKILGPRICGEKEEEIHGVKIIRLKTFEFMRRPYLKGLEMKIKEINPDVIWNHGTASFSAFRTAFFCKKNKIPLLMDNHQHYIASRKDVLGDIYYWFLKLLSKKILNSSVDKFVGLADECCEFMKSKQGIDSSKMVIVPYGVDTELFKFSENARIKIREKLGINKESIVVMQTGKLDDTRKPYWLAEAMTEILSDNKNVSLLFVGSASDKEIAKIKNILEKTNSINRVFFQSFVPQEELPNYYSAADICVYPDYCSLSALEAGASSCVVIVNDLPTGIEREEKGAVITYKRGDIEDLRFKLNKFIINNEYLNKQKEKGCLAVINNYSYDFVAKSAESLMESIIK